MRWLWLMKPKHFQELTWFVSIVWGGLRRSRCWVLWLVGAWHHAVLCGHDTPLLGGKLGTKERWLWWEFYIRNNLQCFALFYINAEQPQEVQETWPVWHMIMWGCGGEFYVHENIALPVTFSKAHWLMSIWNMSPQHHRLLLYGLPANVPSSSEKCYVTWTVIRVKMIQQPQSLAIMVSIIPVLLEVLTRTSVCDPCDHRVGWVETCICPVQNVPVIVADHSWVAADLDTDNKLMKVLCA
jgi:hypothetical protein